MAGKRGAAVAEPGDLVVTGNSHQVPESAAPPDLQALLAWLETNEAKVSWFRRRGSHTRRVKCTLDGGISLEADTLAEVVELCKARLQRRTERCRVSWIA